MKFINLTNNTINLKEIDKIIPYCGNDEQFISPDDIKKSSFFQSLCVQKKIKITGDCNDRIEQNLLKIQNGLIFEKQKQLNVCIRGQFYNNSSYGKVNRNLLMGLLKQGCNVSISPLNRDINGLNELEVQQLDLHCKPIENDTILIDSFIPTFSENVASKYSILYTTVESSSIPKQFINCCEKYNEIWVPSFFCKNILESSGISSPIFVIPNPIDTNLYSMNMKPYSFAPNLKDFVFISIFDWNYRKGYDALIKSYLKAFNGNDNVSLLIVSKYDYDNSGKCKIEKEIKNFIKQYGGNNPPDILRCGRPIIEFEMPKLYRAGNAFVLPSRGEGYGLIYAEASLCGLPVIATNHSGHTMFLNNDNSYLVDIDNLTRTNKMGVHYWNNELFPDLTSDSFIKDLSDVMKDVYINYDKAVLKNNLLKQEILNKYTIDIVAKLAKERLSLIEEII